MSTLVPLSLTSFHAAVSSNAQAVGHSYRSLSMFEGFDERLKIAQEYALPNEDIGLHERLHEMALNRNDLAGYVEHNTAFWRIAAAPAIDMLQQHFTWPDSSDPVQFGIGLHTFASLLSSVHSPFPIPHSPLPFPHSPFPIPHSLIDRGNITIKGKGTVRTYWLEAQA